MAASLNDLKEMILQGKKFEDILNALRGSLSAHINGNAVDNTARRIATALDKYLTTGNIHHINDSLSAISSSESAALSTDPVSSYLVIAMACDPDEKNHRNQLITLFLEAGHDPRKHNLIKNYLRALYNQAISLLEAGHDPRKHNLIKNYLRALYNQAISLLEARPKRKKEAQSNSPSQVLGSFAPTYNPQYTQGYQSQSFSQQFPPTYQSQSFSQQFSPAYQGQSFSQQFSPAYQGQSFSQQFSPAYQGQSYAQQFPPAYQAQSSAQQSPPVYQGQSYTQQFPPTYQSQSFSQQFPPAYQSQSFSQQSPPVYQGQSFSQQFPPAYPAQSYHSQSYPSVSRQDYPVQAAFSEPELSASHAQPGPSAPAYNPLPSAQYPQATAQSNSSSQIQDHSAAQSIVPTPPPIMQSPANSQMAPASLGGSNAFFAAAAPAPAPITLALNPAPFMARGALVRRLDLYINELKELPEGGLRHSVLENVRQHVQNHNLGNIQLTEEKKTLCNSSDDAEFRQLIDDAKEFCPGLKEVLNSSACVYRN